MNKSIKNLIYRFLLKMYMYATAIQIINSKDIDSIFKIGGLLSVMQVCELIIDKYLGGTESE